MPSPGEDIQSWSVTAADNGTADPLIIWSEGQTRASVNNSSRSEMAAHAKSRNLNNGSIVTTGSKNAQAFLSGLSYSSIPTGLRCTLKVGAGLTNDASLTLNMDGLGDTLVKTADGTNLKGGEFIANGYVDLLYNGTNWIFLYGREFFFEMITGGGGIIIGQQIFTASGTYTPTPTMESCIIECLGGGGGGGGCTGTLGYNLTGSGGGGGGFSRTVATAAEVGASQVVTIGAGGVGGVPGLVASSGGATSVGTLCVANGGSGGNYGALDQTPAGGSGGTAGTGSLATPGPTGQGGLNTTNVSAYAILGAGANTIWGSGGRGGALSGGSAIAGGVGTGFGAGGGAASTANIAAAANGGDGRPGLVFITEFAGRGAPGRDGEQGAVGPAGPAGPAGSGTGDVLVSGTPVAGQMAQWVDTSHIAGVTAPFAFSTGDAKLTLKTVADAGWVIMDDGTIGNVGSGATTRANADCQNLYILLWTNIPDAWAPVTGGRGASAAADWAAPKPIKLTRQLGRTLGIAGAGAGLTNRVLGSYLGEETHAQSIAEMPAHNHDGLAAFPYIAPVYNTAVGVSTLSADISVMRAPTGTFSSASISSQGSGTPFNIMQPTSFWNVMIKL